MPKVIKVNWQEYLELIEQLAVKIHRAKYKPDMIVAIATGGLIPGLILSKLFNVPFGNVATERYRSERGKRGRRDVKGRFSYPRAISKTSPGIGERLLVVDDLTEDGETMERTVAWLESRYPDEVKEIRTAVIWHKTKSRFEPDFMAKRVGPDLKKTPWRWPWIDQPIEVYERAVSLTALARKYPKKAPQKKAPRKKAPARRKS